MELSKTIATSLLGFVDEVGELVTDGGLAEAVCDRAYYQGKHVQGTQFQLALLSQILHFIAKVETTRKIATEVRSGVNALVAQYFTRNTFRYLDNSSTLPFDLDTLSATVAALQESDDCLKLANSVLATCWRQDGFPTVFLAQSEVEARLFGRQFHCGDRLWHLDVVVNSLVAQELCPELNLGFSAVAVKDLPPINYWYIPCTFTYFRLAQLAALSRTLFDTTQLEKLDNVDSVPAMKEVFLNRRCNTLENAMHMAAGGFLSASDAEKFIRDIRLDDPVLYPTIGFRPFRSSLLYRGLFFMAITHSLSATSGVGVVTQ